MIWNYSYPLRLRLACPTIDLQRSPHKDLLEDAVNEFNERSETAYNPKRIRDLRHLGNSEITLVLDSGVELESPGRAIRLFSQIIAANEAFAPAIQRGRLFLTLPTIPEIPEVSSGPGEEIHPEDISDELLLNGLVHFFLNKSTGISISEYKKRRAAVDLIKTMALTAGIINMDQPPRQEGKKNEANR